MSEQHTGHLTLRRRVGERIRLLCPDGTAIWVEVREIDARNQVALAVTAPIEVRITREENLSAEERHATL